MRRAPGIGWWAWVWLSALVGCGVAPGLVVESAEDLGALPLASTMKGRDGGYSVRAWEGRSYWGYGDTVLAEEDASGSTWHTNSVSWTDDDDAADGLDGFVEPVDRVGAPALFLGFTEPEQAFNDANVDSGARWAIWPGAMVYDAPRGRVIVLYSKVAAEPGPFAFESVGKGVAIWEEGERQPRRATFDRIPDHPTLLHDASVRVMGDAALIHDGLVYSYGCAGRLRKACRLSRVARGEVLDPGAWRYFDGEGWVADPAEAVALFDGHDILSVHLHEGLDLFVAVYSRPLSNKVMVRTAPAPEGPWSRATLALEARPSDDGSVAYSTVAHPEYDEPGALFLTYHRGTAPFSSELRLVRLAIR